MHRLSISAFCRRGALTVTAYKKRQNEYDEELIDTENWENQQEAAVAIAKVLEGDWQARMALAWKLIKENRTNEADKIICLKTLTPKDPKQQEPDLVETDVKNSGNVLGDPYVLN
ncbi:hypothetical protein WQ57_00745 [Mesobacillus campisalis]|uniref:Uncharacterized protein n=1 Tax=Mesobacillus campisalis TaxID=1408103 RepID=A0A0M2T1M1_9BACI|nr:hypothetical protein [Mesobacillus campisalis]KKK39856.1 hypothetical protein WQ57_00745 [Mesobacillus campisalis]